MLGQWGLYKHKKQEIIKEMRCILIQIKLYDKEHHNKQK